MHGSFGNPEVVAREIGGHFRPGQDKIVRRLFGPVCKLIWPVNTEAHVASLAKVDVRTARRWLSGEYDPPPIFGAIILNEIFKRE